MSRIDAFKARTALLAAGIATVTKKIADKLKPSYSVVWTAIWVPGFLVALWIAMKALGKPLPAGGNSYDDLFDYLIQVGTRSFPVLVAIAITYLVSGRLKWNIDNEERAEYQRILSGQVQGCRWGSFTILAGEMISIMSLLLAFLAALLVWQK